MSTATIVKPVTQQPLHIVSTPEAHATASGESQAKAEINPMVIVFVACVVAFHLAAGMIGTVAAWIYFLRK